jgi:hypothetical protein
VTNQVWRVNRNGKDVKTMTFTATLLSFARDYLKTTLAVSAGVLLSHYFLTDSPYSFSIIAGIFIGATLQAFGVPGWHDNEA